MPSSSSQPGWHPAPAARVRSWLGDWLVVAAWIGVLTLLSLVVRPLLDGGVAGTASPPGRRELLLADLAITLATVVPYLVYLAVTESSRRRATVGKRWARLVVADASGEPATNGQIWYRNIIKALPWQLAHLGVSRAIFEVQLPLAMTFNVLSLALAAACAVPALVGGRGVHDRLAGTRVERASWSDPQGAGAQGAGAQRAGS